MSSFVGTLVWLVLMAMGEDSGPIWEQPPPE